MRYMENTNKKYYLTLTDMEMELLSIIIYDEAGKANETNKYADEIGRTYGYPEEIKSLWKKVMNGSEFPYSLKPRYEKLQEAGFYKTRNINQNK